MNAYTFRSYVMVHQRVHLAPPKLCLMPPELYASLHADVLARTAEIVPLDKQDATRRLLQYLDLAGIPSFFYMGVLVIQGSASETSFMFA